MARGEAGTGDPPGVLPEPADHHDLSLVPVLGGSARDTGLCSSAAAWTVSVSRKRCQRRREERVTPKRELLVIGGEHPRQTGGRDRQVGHRGLKQNLGDALPTGDVK